MTSSLTKTGETFTAVSMFSGCGGMDLGFRGDFTFLGRHYSANPVRIIWANELNPAACLTYSKNLGDALVPGDVWDLMETLPSSADILFGGFPCQDLSINGKLAGLSGKRSGLYRAMVEAIGRVKPRIFIAENVKGLLMKCNAGAVRRVVNDFSDLGYRVTYQLYNAADYGVPQRRERVFIVGTLPEVTPFEPPARERSPSTWITTKDAIDDLRGLKESEAINHIWSRANRSPEQGDRKLKAAQPATTIRAECHGNIQYHYALRRRLSMREAARLQSFPDNFIFDAKLRQTERQIGNAVPPVLAWHIARAALGCLTGAEGISEPNIPVGKQLSLIA